MVSRRCQSGLLHAQQVLLLSREIRCAVLHRLGCAGDYMQLMQLGQRLHLHQQVAQLRLPTDIVYFLIFQLSGSHMRLIGFMGSPVTMTGVVGSSSMLYLKY